VFGRPPLVCPCAGSHLRRHWLVSVGLFLPLAFIAEGSTRPEGTDGDNAAESLLYLQEHPLAYRLSGLFLLLAALGLIRSATAVPWRTPFLTAIGSVAGGLWAFTGALRISSPGPIDHIRGYDEDWGEAAYLSVQMTGTQGGLLSGVVLTAAWIVTGCVIAWRSRTLPVHSARSGRLASCIRWEAPWASRALAAAADCGSSASLR